MNAILRFDGSELWHLAGWTMLHFLWLGTAVGAAAMAFRLVVHRAPASVRYIVALASLMALAASPIGIAAWLVGHGSPLGAAGSASAPLPLPLSREQGSINGSHSTDTSIGGDAIAPIAAAETGDPARNSGELSTGVNALSRPSLPTGRASATLGFDDATIMLESCARYLPWLWLVGTPLTFVLMTTGIVGAERLRRTSRLINDGPIAEACARVKQTMQITRRVTVAVCERIAAPVLVGILRPLILLPPAALTGWSPDEIEMVLLHELAHVRRWDNLVNLLQRIIESLLFFHPAVWLLSSWVRREREACCDAVVVGSTEQPHAYAELLVALAAQMPRSVLFHPANVSLLPAASSAMAAGPLRGRIRRILQLEDDPMLVTRKSLLVVLGGLLVAAAFGVLYVPSPIRAEQQPGAGAQIGIAKPAMNSNVADALDEYRKALVTYDLDFDSVFPQQKWRLPDLKRLERYPTSGAWPNVLGHADRDASSFRVIQTSPPTEYEKATGPNAYLVPLAWNVGTADYATLLFLKGISADSHVTLHSYGSLACFGPMLGDLLFDSYATALVVGDLPGRIMAKSYFDLVVTGKFTGHITCQSYAMIYLMGGFDGFMEINNSKVYIAGRMQESELKRISGTGDVYLEDSDLPAGKHAIGNLAVTVGKRDSTSSATLEIKSPDGEQTIAEFNDGKLKLTTGADANEGAGADASPKAGDSHADWSDHATLLRFEDSLRQKKPLVIVLFNDSGQFHDQWQNIYTYYSGRLHELYSFGLKVEANSDEAKRYDLTARPTCIVFRDGTEVARLADIPSIEELGKFVHAQLDTAVSGAIGEASETPTGKFPSLEKQKLADLAWKRLGLELEPIGEKELKRVKLLGYDGGLKVALNGRGEGAIHAGDILVGLHVWATTNLTDVAEVLNRSDLAELSPLKFYVVRPGAGPNQTGPFRSPEEDQIITDRISVDLDNKPTDASPRRSSYTPTLDANPFATRTSAERPQDRVVSVLGTLAYVREERNRIQGVQQSSGTRADSPAGLVLKSQIAALDARIADLTAEADQLATKAHAADAASPQAVIPSTPTPPASRAEPADPRTIAAPPAPIRLGTSQSPQEGNRSRTDKLVDEALKTDSNMVMLSQQLIQAQHSLRNLDLASTGSAKNAVRLEKQVAAIQKQISEYRQQLTQQIAASPSAERSDHDGRRKDSETEPGTTAAAIKSGEFSLQLAEERIREAAKWRDEAKEQLEQANQQHDDLAIQAAKPEYQTAIQAYVDAKRNFADSRQIYAQQKYEYELEAAGAKTKTLRGDAIRDGDEAKHVAEAERREADEEAKREAKAAGRDAEEQKQEAGQAGREHAAADHSEAADEAHKATVIITKDPSNSIAEGGAVPSKLEIVADEVVVREPLTALSDNSARERLRYDGKTFDAWRDAWRTELSTEKRLEAVKALSAFGANGYGKEAAEAILEVVSQYRWDTFGDTDTLRDACYSAFDAQYDSSSVGKLPIADVLPALLGASKSSNINLRIFAASLLPGFVPENEETNAAVRKMISDDDPQVREIAFRVLRVDMTDPSNTMVDLVRQGLLSNDVIVKKEAIRMLASGQQWAGDFLPQMVGHKISVYYMPELFPLLFSDDESVRRLAREVIHCVSPEVVPTIVSQLEDGLKDDSRKSDHLEAIRALGALGPNAEPAMGHLVDLLRSSDYHTRIGAAAALKWIIGEPKCRNLFADSLGDEFGFMFVKRASGVWGEEPKSNLPPGSKTFSDLFNAITEEQQQVFPNGHL